MDGHLLSSQKKYSFLSHVLFEELEKEERRVKMCVFLKAGKHSTSVIEEAKH